MVGVGFARHRSMDRVGMLLVAVAFAAKAASAQQQLGTKVMGGLGIDAGTQGPPGLYVLDRLLQFDATKARDRNGALLPIQGLDLSARANAIGVAYTFAPKPASPLLTVSAAVPWARLSLSSDEPLASIDRFGLGDVFVQPIKVGWRHPNFDVVTSYAFFAPTGKFEPKSGASVGRGHWTQQFSLGGAIYLDTTRAMRASMLMSYELNGRKRGIDITRGDMLDVQGGAGTTVFRAVVVGVAGYALWQVRNDRGADLPPVLAGARTRSYGLGPEIDVVIPKLGLRGEFRYEWDFGTKARPQGAVFAGGLGYRAWAPSP
jgi:hypothetical protein